MNMDIDIKVQKKEISKLSNFDFNNISFGKDFTDHMFIADYVDGQWGNFQIVPYGNIDISPALSSLHYGQSVFEGMKAFKRDDGSVILLRPEENARRISLSAKRLMIPEIPEYIFIEGLTKLLDIDSEWVPNIKQGSLYIRPFIFATDEFIEVRPSETYRFMIIMSPAGEYYPKPLNVKIETEYTRACPGGVGFSKAAGNYAGSMFPAKKANEEGFDQLIWTDSMEHKYIEESGTMNIFFVINGKLTTPEIGETVLKGITRDSVIKIAKDDGLEVEERKISTQEIIEGIKNGSVSEVFGVGTAVNIANIKSITLGENRVELSDEHPVSLSLKNKLEQIRNGDVEDKRGWVRVV